MFHLRRAAVRALSQHSQALSRTSQPFSSRVTSFSQTGSKPIAWRGFHQARIWRAEEEQKGDLAKEGGASPAEEANAAETVTEKAQEVAAETAEKAEEVAANTAQNFSQAAEAAPSATETAAQAEEVAASTTKNFIDAAQSGAEATAAAAASNLRQPSSRAYNRPQHDTTSTHRNPRPSRILYIGNLFFEVTAQQLEAEFAAHGSITNSRIVTDSRGLSKGFGYIEFAEQESADAAVRALDQKVFQGRRMAVQYHVQRKPGERGAQGRRGRPNMEPSKTLFIGNMSYQMSDRDLNDLFREIRDVLDVRVAIDRRSGQPRGFAHADFIDVPSAQRAKEHLEKKVVYGRQLKVDYSGNSNRDSA